VLVAGWAVQTADAWILTREVNNVAATDQGRLNVRVDPRTDFNGTDLGLMYRNDLCLGGHDGTTNSFPAPFRTLTAYQTNSPTVSPTAPTDTQTLFRYTSLTGGTLAPDANEVYFFGTGGHDTNQGLAVTDVYWDDCGDPADVIADPSEATFIPALSVSYERTSATSVDVTVTNAMAVAIDYTNLSGSAVAYGSVSAASLNSTDSPCGAGTSGNLAAGASTTLTVAADLDEDVVVCYSCSWAMNASTSTNWHAMDSGAPLLLADAYLGRYLFWDNNPVSATGDVAIMDSRAKGPLKRISGTGLAAYTPEDIDQDNDVDILIDTTQGAGVKRSYLRSNGQDLYSDVRLRVQVNPGAEVGNTTACPGITIASADNGGPVALCIQPGAAGGSYYASVCSGRPNEISIYRDNGDGTSTQLATASQWSDLSAIDIDFDLVFDGAIAATEDLYDVDFSKCGSTLTLTVNEMQYDADGFWLPTGRTVTMDTTDSTYDQGYVGIRSERDGSLDYDPTNCPSGWFEGLVQEFKVTLCSLDGPMLGKKVIYVGASDSRTDAGSAYGWSSRGSRVGVVLSGAEKEANLTLLGADVDHISCNESNDINLPYTNAYFDANYDLVYVDGSCSSAISRDRLGCLAVAAVMCGEHAATKCNKMGMGGTESGEPSSAHSINLVRKLPAVDGGDPAHPIVAGLPIDGSDTTGQDGLVQIKVYEEPLNHLQGTSEGGATTVLLGHTTVTAICDATPVPAGSQWFRNGQRMGWLQAAEAGAPIPRGCTCDASCGCPANTGSRWVFFGWGDYQPSLSECGLALYQRSAIWATGGDASVIAMPSCLASPGGESYSPVPAVTNWGVGIMTLLLLASAVTIMRRRRVTA